MNINYLLDLAKCDDVHMSKIFDFAGIPHDGESVPCLSTGNLKKLNALRLVSVEVIFLYDHPDINSVAVDAIDIGLCPEPENYGSLSIGEEDDHFNDWLAETSARDDTRLDLVEGLSMTIATTPWDMRNTPSPAGMPSPAALMSYVRVYVHDNVPAGLKDVVADKVFKSAKDGEIRKMVASDDIRFILVDEDLRPAKSAWPVH